MIIPPRTSTQPTGGLGKQAGKASFPCAIASRMKVASVACRSCSCFAGMLVTFYGLAAGANTPPTQL
jgi:hypothetical protein